MLQLIITYTGYNWISKIASSAIYNDHSWIVDCLQCNL